MQAVHEKLCCFDSFTTVSLHNLTEKITFSSVLELCFYTIIGRLKLSLIVLLIRNLNRFVYVVVLGSGKAFILKLKSLQARIRLIQQLAKFVTKQLK